ncbi:phage portal protein [Paenibacillus sp. 598K]|uniref:phage tail assembly chaperone n=1 Tax=Paenibacillus sp. 598K TaxID=1117987 RepID=UPI000FFA317B|nr:phage portal protein [Paenibacillus sp. 598K]GBF75768.1 phage portal protein [Paenibacillus sp. 598K]
MSNLSAFYMQNAAPPELEEVVVSSRFKGPDGKPVAWKLRSMTEEENEAIRKAATRQIKGKGGSRTTEINGDEYIVKLVESSIVYPNLKDAELQKSYGVLGADKLLRKMLLPGEYSILVSKVQEVNGFDRDMDELISDVKN